MNFGDKAKLALCLAATLWLVLGAGAIGGY